MVLKSLKNAVNGIKLVFLTENNFRIIIVCFILAAALGFIVRLSGIEWAVILICCGVVISLEMVNTAIESAVDLQTNQYKVLAKKAKDIAAGATLVFSIFSAAIGIIIFVPHILEWFYGGI